MHLQSSLVETCPSTAEGPFESSRRRQNQTGFAKYMVTLGYVGEYLDQEAQEVQEEEEVRRVSSRSKVSFDEKAVTRIIQDSCAYKFGRSSKRR